MRVRCVSSIIVPKLLLFSRAIRRPARGDILVTVRRKSSVMLLLGLTFSCAFVLQPVSAQGGGAKASAGRSSAPTGAEIATAARAGTLERASAVTATVLGKPFRFTPARTQQGALPAPGIFLGVLENGAAGDETGLPPGTYNLFAAQVGGQWKGYAESNGQVVREAIRVRAAASTPDAKPYFNEKGWCLHTILFSLCF
jgi:hypothetical protein